MCLRDNDAATARLEVRKSQILAGEVLGPLLALAYAGPVLAHACAFFAGWGGAVLLATYLRTKIEHLQDQAEFG